MKTNVPLFKGAVCLLVLLNSCTSSKNSIDQHKAEMESAKEESTCFVQMKDGSVKNYTSLKLVTGVFKTPHLVADGGVIITANDIKAYQSKEHYAISQKEFSAAKPSYVAVEALPGFAVRVAKGKLNVFALKYYNGHNTTEKFYLQSGDDGQIAAYTPELMKALIRDNNEAFNFFTNKKKAAVFPKNLLATADIYNNQRYVSKN
ncbi:hypothetical protein [Ferruginibacter profundus]